MEVNMSKFYYTTLPVEDIHLDLNNPRIVKWIEMYGDDIQTEQIALALGAGSSQDGEGGPSFTTLRRSIEAHGGIIHPIIVNKDESGKYVIIEGNTRTLIYREFRKQKDEKIWDKIPAIVYESMSPALIDAIRLQAHLVGTRQWDPYSKAKYLNHLNNVEHLTSAQIVDFCGGNRREVESFVQAYQDIETYYRSLLDSDQDFDHTRFSAFVELQAERVKQALLDHGHTKKDFARWVHERKIYPLNTVRILPRILQNKKSREIFLREGAREAIKALETGNITTEVSLGAATLNQLTLELLRRINNLSYDEVKRLRNDEHSDNKEVIFDAKDAIVGLCEDITLRDE